MYESPIERMFGEIQTKIIEQGEAQIMQAVQNCGVSVDKEELIKALTYDRNQYEKGYADAKAEQRWIPCEEVEPEEDQECWFTVNDRGFRYVNRGCFTRRYGERRDKGFITAGGFAWWNTAIAWMPIPEPEPYKGETDGKDD